MITFIIGGARSGKSKFALERASPYQGRKAYIATAQALDDEMKGRIKRHKEERSCEWTTFEEPLNISALTFGIHRKYDIILIDCLTIWLSNMMLADKDIEFEIANFMDALHVTHSALRIFIVSNEVGMGIVPENEMARMFRDLAGHLNQKVAAIADEVYLVTAGMPIKVKG